MASFLDKLFSKGGALKSAHGSTESKNQEMRAYARYSFPELSQIRVELQNGKSYPIVDLSYGGLSVLNIHEKSLTENPCIRLHFFGNIVQADIYHVYTSDRLAGFSFKHATPEVLLFLRGYIEYVRTGNSCKELSRAILKAPYNKEEWFCYRGDGPCDVYLNNLSKEMLVIFPSNGQYAQIRINKGIIHTGISEQSQTGYSSAKLNESTQVDPKIVEKTILILCGISNASNSNEIEAFIKVLSEAIKEES